MAESQAPECLFITCADSRVLPDLILGTEPGDLFISRSIGNVVPAASLDAATQDAATQGVDGVTATIEYAVEVLKDKARHRLRPLRLRGDEGGAESGWACQSARARRWLEHVDAAFAHRQPLNPADGESAELASLIRGNVVAQLMNLRAQPAVARAENEGRLTVHGWYYDILTGRIERYDERLKRFEALAEVSAATESQPAH